MKKSNQYLTAIIFLILLGLISYSKPKAEIEIIKEPKIDIVWWNSLDQNWKKLFYQYIRN